MLRSRFAIIIKRNLPLNFRFERFVSNLSPEKITQLLTKNEVNIAKHVLPTCIESIECNQLASNSPIEDRLRISSLQLPGSNEPTLIMGVFDGHGGGTTVDLISRRLFNYIALSLHPKPENLKISKNGAFKHMVTDIHTSPKLRLDPALEAIEMESLSRYKTNLSIAKKDDKIDIASNLKASFKQCDDDLSLEIQENLLSWQQQQNSINQSTLHYYLSAAVSGCCALVMVVHEGMGYLASTGDCRAALGICQEKSKSGAKEASAINHQAISDTHSFSATELNDEHNCDNINEIRRLTASHPRSEQNTMIKHNRLLGHLMPFRAFGDFNYKWPAELIKASGITKAFGSGVIPSNYNTPPYLIVEPDVTEVKITGDHDTTNASDDRHKKERYLVIASDGLWELFESSREVIETIVDHSVNASQLTGDYDLNRATHILRSALRSGSQQEYGMDAEELKRLYHIRLESTLTLPQAIVRNFRDDISILVLKIA